MTNNDKLSGNSILEPMTSFRVYSLSKSLKRWFAAQKLQMERVATQWQLQLCHQSLAPCLHVTYIKQGGAFIVQPWLPSWFLVPLQMSLCSSNSLNLLKCHRSSQLMRIIKSLHSTKTYSTISEWKTPSFGDIFSPSNLSTWTRLILSCHREDSR